MESHGKPYLILQLDEHDSNVGYETRIEAAVRSFRNHHAKANIAGHIHYRPELIPSSINRLNGKTLIFPNWDALSLKLLMVCLRQRGIDARLLEESEGAIQESLHFNTGQCIPLNIIAMEFIDYVRRHNLDPCNTALWMMDSVIPLQSSPVSTSYQKPLCLIRQGDGTGGSLCRRTFNGGSVAESSPGCIFCLHVRGTFEENGMQDQTLRNDKRRHR